MVCFNLNPRPPFIKGHILRSKVFGGDIGHGGKSGIDISNSGYGEGEYWPLNFNDFASGLGTLFTLLHVSKLITR